MGASELEGQDARLIARILRNQPSAYAGAELAGQHRRALLEQADARRLYGAARARPAPRMAGIRIRPIRPYDAVRLAPGFGRLLRPSRLSWLLDAKTVSTAEHREQPAEREQHDDETQTLIAVRRDGIGVGVGGYARNRDDAAAAELAVTVIEGWRCRGIATRLVTRLSDGAKLAGVTRFTAYVPDESEAAQRLLAHVPGVATLVDRETYRIDLDSRVS
jgi:hypothetical protein